jgi:hypothetical protein
MLNLLTLLRYLVFVVFVASNAIIASAAAWNLSLVEDIAGDGRPIAATAISIYLIVLGALGLIVIFIVIFVDLCEKDVFIGRVWFELSWIILFFIMALGGAAAITAQNDGQVCNSDSSVSLCASTQVLQGFTWICAILLFGYFILFFVLSILKYRDDTAIWSWSVRKLIWQHTHKTVVPPLPSLPSFRTDRTQVPVIAAPRPRRIITMPEAGLSHRSGLGFDYQIEHYQPPAAGATDLGPSTDRPLSPLLLTLPTSPTPVSPTRNLPQKPLPAAFAPFYPSYVQAAINPGLSRTSTAHSSQVPNLSHASHSPPPLGDWPQRDVTSLPARGKRKQNPPAPYSFTMPTAAQQRGDQPPRSRPCGPRRRSNSGDQRPPSP